MIDFKLELEKILKEDPLGILRVTTSKPITQDQRLVDSFEEINIFIDENGKEPVQSTDINERRLYSRLAALRKDFDKASILKDFDKHNLLEGVRKIETVDDILNNDVLGLIHDNSENIFNLQHVPKNREKTDFVARRKPCENFDQYKDRFLEIQKEIRSGKRKLILFREVHLKEGRYYILDGILLFLEKIDGINIKEFNDKTQGKRKRYDPRIKCIFENGLESNMYLRSLQKELYNNGRTVIETNEESLEIFNQNFGLVSPEDKITGYIYILSSLSNNPQIQAIKDLHKIGYSTRPVEERIENAEKDPTFLMAPVKIVSTYKVYNFSPRRFESVIHSFFKDKCLDFKIADNSRISRKPKEWYVVPLQTIDQVIQLIINNEISNYKFNTTNSQIEKII
jgi:hypothetical protein